MTAEPAIANAWQLAELRQAIAAATGVACDHWSIHANSKEIRIRGPEGQSDFSLRPDRQRRQWQVWFHNEGDNRPHFHGPDPANAGRAAVEYVTTRQTLAGLFGQEQTG